MRGSIKLNSNSPPAARSNTTMASPNAKQVDKPAPFELSHDPFGRLVLILSDGAQHVGVEPVRAFPIAEPNRFISIVDAHGRELISIDALHDLPSPLAQMLAQELRAREFVPIIERIERIAVDKEPAEWEVHTDRGPVTFLLGNADDVRRIDRDRATITDLQGIRYLIASLKHLDGHSRRLLEHFI
jgi:hypothetical protein